MIIQVNHDNHIEGSSELTQMVQALLRDQLARFSAQITRIEVHFSDDKMGGLSSRPQKLLPIRSPARMKNSTSTPTRGENLSNLR